MPGQVAERTGLRWPEDGSGVPNSPGCPKGAGVGRSGPVGLSPARSFTAGPQLGCLSVEAGLCFPPTAKTPANRAKRPPKLPLFANFARSGGILHCSAARSVLFTEPTFTYPRGGVARHSGVLFEPSREG